MNVRESAHQKLARKNMKTRKITKQRKGGSLQILGLNAVELVMRRTATAAGAAGAGGGGGGGGVFSDRCRDGL